MKSRVVERGFFGVIAALAVFAGGCATTRTSITTGATRTPSGPVVASTIEPGVIPTGTTFAIRTNDPITSTDTGKAYSARIEHDMLDQSGRLLVPKGSPAELVVVQSTPGGGVGSPGVELALKSVTVNGKNYAIATAGVQQTGEEGLGANRRTAEMVGGGAALGTLLGVAVGGGKGAVIGAITGTAGGVAAQVLTRGKNINVPSETVLTFRLDQPLRLQGFAF